MTESNKKGKVELKIDFYPVPSSDNETTDSTQDDEFRESDTACGIGSFKPQWLQNLNNPKIFLLNHSLLGVLQGAFFSYLVGCLSTLEKRYAYETKTTGIIMISDEISPVLFGLFLGYFGGKSHRPRIVGVGMFIGTLSCFVMALPYFIYGSASHLSERGENFIADNKKVEYCDRMDKDLMCEKVATLTAISLLFLGNFLKGFGSLAFYTIGTSFMDDSVKKKDSPVYFGTLFALRLLGPILGFLLSSFCLQYYENPFHDPGFGQKDPRWIGAWWLGFIILGVAIFIFSLPMMLFPRRFPNKKIPESLAKKKKEEQETPWQQLKGMGKALKRLGKNPILCFHYLGGVFRLNGVVGYYVLLPKYMEMQFRQSASKASLYSGPASIVGMQIGILFGGILIRKFKPRPRVLTGGIMFAESFSVMALLSCMLITCPIYHMAGTTKLDSTLELENSCNRDCLCTTKVFTPVCGSDGTSTYFSPCYAGCTGYNKTDDIEKFTDCKCLVDDVGDFSFGSTLKNYCDSDCQWMVTFIVILSIGKMLSSTARVGSTIVTLRCVDPEDKSIALGALNGVFSLLAFIPYPLIYGALTDASCLVWEESCGKRGNCWIYDADKFRFLLHGVSAGFVFLGCVTDIFVWYLSPQLRELYEDESAKPNDESSKDHVRDEEIIGNGGFLNVIKTGIPNNNFNSVNGVDEKEKATTTM